MTPQVYAKWVKPQKKLTNRYFGWSNKQFFFALPKLSAIH